MTISSVGVVIDALHAGGVEKIAINQTRALNDVNTPTQLVVLKRTSLENHPFAPLLKEIPVLFLDDRLPKILKLSFKIPFFSFFSWHHLTYPLLLPFFVKKGEFEVFVSHGTYTSLTTLSLKLTRGIPFLVSLWDPIYYILKRAYRSGPIHFFRFLLLPSGRLVDKVLLRQARSVLVAGHAHQQYLQTIGIKNPQVLYPGVQVENRVVRAKGNYLLAVTAWKEGKNQDFLLDILQQIPRIDVVMAGSWHPSELKTDFETRVNQMGLKPRLKITGPLEESELRKLYKEARLFLQISDDRGFGMPALEAASSGCPFIIPKDQGVGELFEDGVDGFFVDLKDKEEVVEKIKLLLKDQNLGIKMGTSGWEKVKMRYSWKQHAIGLKRLLENDSN